MLEDFIEINNSKAKIINDLIRKPTGAVCKLFVAENMNPVLAIYSAKRELDLNKLSKITGVKLMHEPDAVATEKITGYLPGFIPPISIYGLTLIIDSWIMEQDLLYFFIGKDKTLEIPSEELLEFNEDVIIEEITS